MEVIAPKKTGEKCPECGHDLVERHGRYGKFVACENYPECKYIKKKKWNLNILVKHVQNAVAQWFSKQGVMVNLKHVQIIQNVNILKTLEKGRTSYDR